MLRYGQLDLKFSISILDCVLYESSEDENAVSGVTTEFLGRSQATATMTAEDGMNDPLEYSDDKYQAFFFTVSSTSTYRLPHYLPRYP
jgi:hypothetical protein